MTAVISSNYSILLDCLFCQFLVLGSTSRVEDTQGHTVFFVNTTLLCFITGHSFKSCQLQVLS